MTTMAPVAEVDTGRVGDRRKLRFANSRELLADAERIAAADRAGRLRRSGNWTAGQAFGHLAAWASYPYDGYPPRLHAPWFIKLIIRLKKRQFLHGSMPGGVRIPKVEGGTAGTEPLSLDDGLSRLKEAWQRLDARPPEAPNPIFGPLTHDEWKAINLRHAELHLSFLHPQ
jgi:hypothetical protein